MPTASYYSKNKDRLLEAAKQLRINNPDIAKKQNEKSKEWREANKEKFREMQKDWMKDNPNYYYLNNARARAKAQGVPYLLTNKFLRTLEIPDICPYLGIPLIKGGAGGTENSPSLDKIIPELGYVPGNVEFISSRANRLKNDGTPAELMAIAKRLADMIDH